MVRKLVHIKKYMWCDRVIYWLFTIILLLAAPSVSFADTSCNLEGVKFDKLSEAQSKAIIKNGGNCVSDGALPISGSIDIEFSACNDAYGGDRFLVRFSNQTEENFSHFRLAVAAYDKNGYTIATSSRSVSVDDFRPQTKKDDEFFLGFVECSEIDKIEIFFDEAHQTTTSPYYKKIDWAALKQTTHLIWRDERIVVSTELLSD